MKQLYKAFKVAATSPLGKPELCNALLLPLLPVNTASEVQRRDMTGRTWRDGKESDV